MVAGYSSKNPYIQALNNSTSYHGRSVSPFPSYSTRVYETPRTSTTVTSYHTPTYSYSSRTTRSSSVTPPTIRQRTASPGIPHIAHQRLTPTAAPPRTANLYLDDIDLVGTNGKYATTISKYDDDLSKPLLQQLTDQTSDLRAQMNSVLAKIQDNSHLKGMNNIYPVPGFSARGERVGTERPGRTGGYADSRILGPMRDVHHDVYNIARYEEPGKKIGIGKGHLACMEFAGGKPVMKRRQKFYDDEKIPLEIKILANLNGKPRHERRKPVEPKPSIRDDGYVPWRERLAKDLTYVPQELKERENIPEPEPHNPDRNWELPKFEPPTQKARKQEEEVEESSRVPDPELSVVKAEAEETVHQPEPFPEQPLNGEPEQVVTEEEVKPKKEKRKKKHSKVEESQEEPAHEAPKVQAAENPEPASKEEPVAEPVPDTKVEPEPASVPQVYVESDIEELIVSHENPEGYDEHVRSENEQVFHLDHRFMSSDEGGSPLPLTPQAETWIENPLAADLASSNEVDATAVAAAAEAALLQIQEAAAAVTEEIVALAQNSDFNTENQQKDVTNTADEVQAEIVPDAVETAAVEPTVEEPAVEEAVVEEPSEAACKVNDVEEIEQAPADCIAVDTNLDSGCAEVNVVAEGENTENEAGEKAADAVEYEVQEVEDIQENKCDETNNLE